MECLFCYFIESIETFKNNCFYGVNMLRLFFSTATVATDLKFAIVIEISCLYLFQVEEF